MASTDRQINYTPPRIYSHEHYTNDDMYAIYQEFIPMKDALRGLSEPNLYNSKDIYLYLESIWNMHYFDADAIKQTSKIRLYYYLYCVPLEELPLHLNHSGAYEKIVRWRLKNAK
jgi:hypothetical protein